MPIWQPCLTPLSLKKEPHKPHNNSSDAVERKVVGVGHKEGQGSVYFSDVDTGR